MLIDELIANGAPGSGCDVSCMFPVLRAAQKFKLSPEFTAVADALSSDYTGLVKAFPHCRLPYAQTWIEVSHTARPQFAASPIQVPMFQIQPKRIGYLLTATRDDLSAWKAHLFWSFENQEVNGASCPLMAMEFDMCNTVGVPQTELPTDDWVRAQPVNSRIVKYGDATPHPGWNAANESVRLAMMNHSCPVMADYAVNGMYLPELNDIPPEERMPVIEELLALARSDWAGEPAFILAVVALLNARNVIQTVQVDNTEFNRKRAKRGRLPLFSHKVLKIAHRQIKRVYGDAGHQGDYQPMRGHFVRGHWKIRKTGVYFWHPFTRGDFTRGKVSKDYEVTS